MLYLAPRLPDKLLSYREVAVRSGSGKFSISIPPQMLLQIMLYKFTKVPQTRNRIITTFTADVGNWDE